MFHYGHVFAGTKLTNPILAEMEKRKKPKTLGVTRFQKPAVIPSVDFGIPGGGWRKIVLRGVLRGGEVETGTPGGGWICFSVTGCVTHKHLWKLDFMWRNSFVNE